MGNFGFTLVLLGPVRRAWTARPGRLGLSVGEPCEHHVGR
jgi:hypothetical protein